MKGIYSIFNKSNYKRYIGSTNDFNRRKREHFNLLRLNKHYNVHLQRAWNVHGEEYFEFEIIEEVEFEDLLQEREELWIDYFESYKCDKGYNVSQYPERIGSYSWDEDRKEKMRLLKLGGKLSQEHKNKISNSLKGKRKPPGFGENISRTRKGSNNPNYGKHLSDETKSKIAEGNMGRKCSDENKNKLSILYSGEKSYNATLTNIEVEKIKYMFSEGYTYEEIQRQYNASKDILRSIKEVRRWKRIAPELNDTLRSLIKGNSGENSHSAKLTEIQVKEIKHRLANGEMVKILADEYNVSHSVISGIKNVKTWKSVLPELNEQLKKLKLTK